MINGTAVETNGATNARWPVGSEKPFLASTRDLDYLRVGLLIFYVNNQFKQLEPVLKITYYMTYLALCLWLVTIF